MKIGIIDFGVGNINSIFSMYRYLGVTTEVVSSHHEISNLDKIILPGVGSFDYGMISIRKKGFFDIGLNKNRPPGIEIVGRGMPLICIFGILLFGGLGLFIIFSSL